MEEDGFTLIEILIVIAVIAVIGLFSALAVNTARSKQRDAVRISQVRQIQSALENHFNEVNQYPQGQEVPLGDISSSRCLSVNGFSSNCSADPQTFLRVITPTIDKGLDGVVRCGAPLRDGYCYSSISDDQNYQIQFELENALRNVGLIKGPNCATPEGIKGGAC